MCGTVYGADTLRVDLSQASMEGGIVEFPISLISTETINAVDFLIEFDNENLGFVSITKHFSGLIYSNSLENDNILRFTSYSQDPIPDDEPIISLNFTTDSMSIVPLDFIKIRAIINGNAQPVKVIAPLCPNSELKLRASNSPTDSYLWSTGETTQQIQVTSEGVFYATITELDGTIRISQVWSVENTELPENTITIGGSTSFCYGESVALSAVQDNNYSYLWNSGGTTQSIAADTTKEYFALIKNVNNCIAVSDTVSVTAFPLPQPELNLNGNSEFCDGDSLVLTAETGFLYTYLWSTGETTSSIKVKETGDFYAVITNSFSCSIQSDTVSTVVLSAPVNTITLSGPTSFCPGSSVALSSDAESDVTYLWSNGATSQSITVTEQGDYSVQTTGLNGCSSTSEPISVEVGLLSADIDDDGMVGFSDLISFSNRYSQECTCPEDIDGDGIVGFSDLFILSNEYGRSCE
jgi:hypothetical protein